LDSGELGREPDLVVVALPGVQRFIAESRSTSDVSAASGIYSRLARVITGALLDDPAAELVLPAPTLEGLEGPAERGMPNRVVALLPPGTGEASAARGAAAAGEAWQSWIRAVWRLPSGAPVPPTPGFPVVQWACVPAGPGGYPEQWRRAQRLIAARRRVRDFAPVPGDEWRQRALCSLAPRWPAEPKAPPRVPRHDQESRLSVTGWVKRRWASLDGAGGFPSTASIASAPYRRAVLEGLGDEGVRQAVDDLERAGRQLDAVREAPVSGLGPLVPDAGLGRWLGTGGGPWVYPDRWETASVARETGPRDDLAEIAAAGKRAAIRLRAVMAERGVQLAGYLAVVVQDLDSMGRFLGGEAPSAGGEKVAASPGEHRRVSGLLQEVAAAQWAVLRSGGLLGVPVYAGGDDLLAFVPAARALAAAQECHAAVPLALPRASSAVLYFHYHASIQRAMSEARRMLETAKSRVPGKHGLAVGYLRRSGASAMSVQPWTGPDGETSAGLFGVFARSQEGRLSPGLAADLLRDAGELAALSRVSARSYQQELARLVRRHTEGGGAPAARAAGALGWLGGHEHAPGEVPGPHAAAQVGVFLRQEAR
jgi:hypothetical protein